MRDDVLETVDALAADLGIRGDETPDPVPGPPVLLDVRWSLGMTDGRARYEHGHLPGAVYVDLETELAAPASSAEGRHPLPSAAAFEASARRWGVSTGSRVVVYDSVGGTSAARAWWLLRYFGARDVRILDGGLDAWTEAGLPLESGDVLPEPGAFEARPGGLPVLTADEAAALASDGGVLLDARAGERYRGETEPVDPRAGHIPGALSVPTAGNLGEDSRFLPDDALRERLAPALEDRPVGVYCGSGVTAAHQVAALAAVGVEAALYPGSWSQWSNDPGRPAATGPRP